MAVVVGLSTGEEVMQIKKRMLFRLISILVILGGLSYWLSAKEKSPPERSFSTSRLLISSLPGWGIYSGPEDWMPHDFYLQDVIDGSVIRFMKPPNGISHWTPADVNNGLLLPIADMEQWVVKFSSYGKARKAYREHYWIVDDPSLLDNLEHKSQVAEQSRIVCKHDQEIVVSCYVEAQYREFYILVRYSSVNLDNKDYLLSDLEAIITAIDVQMEKFLDSNKE